MVGSGHNRLLKILHIDPEKNWGGGEAQVLGLLAYLAERGHDDALLAHPHGQLFNRCRDLKIKRVPLRIRNDLDLRPVLALRRLVREERYDIVHLHTKRAHALSLWLPAGPKYLVTRRMDYPESKSPYTRYLYNRRVDGVVAISRAIADLLRGAGVGAERIRLIPSGIDVRRFDVSAGPGAPEEVSVIGTAAVLEERKGQRFLLEAAARLKAQGHRVRYRIAGDGSLRARLEALARELGLADDVEFCGFVADMPAFLAKLDVFVLPSLHEGLGVAALEAMAAGKPVVAARVGGLAEVVSDDVTGLLVAPRDTAGLADAIARLVADRSLARQMGQSGRERVGRHFSLEQMAMKNEAYYYELLDGVA